MTSLNLAAETRIETRRRPRFFPPFIYTAPAMLVAIGTLLPVAYLVLRALGAENFVELLFRPRTIEVLVRTLALTAAVTLTSITLSIPLAWLTVRTDLPLRRMWAVLIVLPLVIPSYVGGFTIVAALGPRGLAQQLLAPLGVERLPEIYGFFGAWFTLTLFSYPYVLLSVRAAVRGLDPSLEDAARGLGHSAPGVFRRVVLPQLKPAIASGALLVALYTLSDFGAVSLLQFDTFSRAIYTQYRGSFDRSLAAVLSLVLVAITLVLLFAEARLRGRARYHRNGGGSKPPAPKASLGRWRWPALGFCALVVGLGVVMPLGVIGYWLIQGVSHGETIHFVWQPTLNSLAASALAAAATLLGALPIAIMSVRHPGAWTSIIERVTYSGFALPPIATALALVFFAANFVPWLYQTLLMLILAYAVRFTPQAIGPIRASLLQVSPHVEDAARGLGRTPLQVVRAITLPLVRPGILAGGALVFLTTMKELPATLLLSPIGFTTLATQTWSATSEAFFARAAVPAWLLVLFSSLSMIFVLAGERETKT
jgi:iron(III) transport system permease protein